MNKKEDRQPELETVSSDGLPALRVSTVVCVQVLFPGRHASAQVALCFVVFQNILHFDSKSRIHFQKPLGHIFMYRCNNYNGFYWCIA